MSWCTVLTTALVVTVVISMVACERVHYHGDKVFRITPKDDQQLEILKRWIKENPKLDVWRPSNKVDQFMDIHITKNDVTKVKKMLKINNIEYKITIEDLEKDIEGEKKTSVNGNAYGLFGRLFFNYDTYNRYGHITAQLVRVSEKHKSTSKFTLLRDKSSQGVSLYGLMVHEANRFSAKPAVILDGAMHGRDWITTSTLVYLTKLLLEPEESEMRKKVTKVLSNYDVYIFPVINPDGYDYTHTTDRMWSKTRSRQGACRGVDMNRNYAVKFGENVNGKSDPCANDYPGPKAYTEKEVNNIASFIANKKLNKGCIAYWNLYAGGENILYPYGYRDSATWYNKALNHVATAFATGANKRNGRNYVAGQASKLQPIAGGQAIDWAYDRGDVTYAFATHLRPGNGDKAFILPESKIKPTALEFADGFLDAMIAIIDY